MSGKISSIFSSSEKLDISKMSFEERLQYGAENAVRCMGVTSHDRVFIITDYERENIARRVAVAALDRHADVQTLTRSSVQGRTGCSFGS